MNLKQIKSGKDAYDYVMECLHDLQSGASDEFDTADAIFDMVFMIRQRAIKKGRKEKKQKDRA